MHRIAIFRESCREITSFYVVFVPLLLLYYRIGRFKSALWVDFVEQVALFQGPSGGATPTLSH